MHKESVMAVIIRPSQSGDIAAFTAIYAHHVLNASASFETTPPDAAEMSRRRDDVLRRGLPYLAAECDGVVLGFAYAAPYRARPAYRFTLEDSIYLRHDAIGQGAGRLLLEALIAACTEAGYRQIIAVIGDSANAGSIGLHRACGFAPVGVLPAVGFKFGRWVDSVLMQRALGAGAGTAPASEEVALPGGDPGRAG
jgi:phosphinothricin acetyltransferase